MKRITRQVGDPRVLELTSKFLKAGYIDPASGKLVVSNTGTPQGGILSPLLSNIVLNELDIYMDKSSSKFRKGLKRRINPEYKSLAVKRSKSTDALTRADLLSQMRKVRRTFMGDPNFKRLEYIRYADDFIVFVSGTLKDAEFIKSNIQDYLKSNCGLELNLDKTVISNLLDDKWVFLGAEIKRLKSNPEWRVNHVNGEAVGVPKILVKAPISDILNELKKGGFVRQNAQRNFYPQGYTKIMNLSHYEILSFYNSKIHGILNFYSFASNRFALSSILWLLKASCALTLARKLKLRTLRKVFQKFGPTLKCPETDVKIYNPASLKVIHDFKSNSGSEHPAKILRQTWTGKLTKSSFNKVCAICGTSHHIEMHHIRSIKGVRAKFRKGEKISFAEFQAGIKRKQVPLCSYHHKLYHKGGLNFPDLKTIANYQ
jgi:Type II intron maturase/Reverse transcriptase (RNA-dependent DNA polymerase)